MAVRWAEGYAPVVGDATTKGLMQVLADKITNNSADANWILHYPSGFDAITNVFTIKHTVGATDVYIEFFRPTTLSVVPRSGGAAVTKDNFYCMEVKFGTNYTAPTTEGDKGTWGVDTDSARARFSWFMSDTPTTIKGWLPVQYWVSVEAEKVSIILAGDPSANFNDRLISFGYMGAIKPFKEDVGTDDDTNFGINFSSDMSPFDYLTENELNQYSDKTGTGVVDINMLKTFTGFPMQAHYASFTTPDEFVNKQLEGPSAYTKKYHMSPVYVFHGFDGYRGELTGVVATDRSTVVNLDEMVHKYNPTDANAAPTQEDIYKVFLVNAPFSIFNNSTNVLYGVAILKDSKAIV
jgi:hypothetical protein